jgi:hypothetical protein
MFTVKDTINSQSTKTRFHRKKKHATNHWYNAKIKKYPNRLFSYEIMSNVGIHKHTRWPNIIERGYDYNDATQWYNHIYINSKRTLQYNKLSTCIMSKEFKNINAFCFVFRQKEWIQEWLGAHCLPKQWFRVQYTLIRMGTSVVCSGQRSDLG